MMNPIELGVRIAEIRKEKGLTQNELALKCGVTPRTIQRIESGEVNARIYTLKAISRILETDFLSDIKKNQSKHRSSQIIERLKINSLLWNIINLFNLKTNTMKKITILSVILSAILFSVYSISSDSQAQESETIDYSKFMLPSLCREILYVFPKGEPVYISNVKDTADYILMGDKIQEYKKNIYLNGKFVGKVLKSDTIIYNFGELIIKPYHWKYTSSYGQNIHYFIPLGTPIKNSVVSIDTEYLYIDDHVLKEHDFKIYLDDEYQGQVVYGDSVLYRDGLIEFLD